MLKKIYNRKHKMTLNHNRKLPIRRKKKTKLNNKQWLKSVITSSIGYISDKRQNTK